LLPHLQVERTKLKEESRLANAKIEGELDSFVCLESFSKAVVLPDESLLAPPSLQG